MIVGPEPTAVEEGLTVLRSGGNAVDAAVTAALVQGVVDPHMCGIGGSGVMLVYTAHDRSTTAIEFYARAGSLVRADQWEHLFIREADDRYGYILEGHVNDVGYQSVAVPGTVAGCGEALRRFGTISWADSLQPAIRHARNGFVLTGHVREYWMAERPGELPNLARITATPASADIYTREGRVPPLGEVIPCEDYARTLERLAGAGPDDFYRGDIAAGIARDMSDHGGLITADDLATYRVRIAAPVRGAYRGRDVVTAGPPAGGLTLLQMLNFLEGFDIGADAWPSTQAALRRVQAMDWAVRDRVAHLADPEFSDVPVDSLIDKSYAEVARSIHDRPTTTHLSVIDAQGNAVSMTHTLGSASGVVTKGLGFTYNNYMNCFDPRPGNINSLEPGKTRFTMMAPAFIFEKDRLRANVGAPGGTKIVTAVLQTLLNVLDHGMDPVNAINAPRLDYQGEVVEVENRMPQSTVDGLIGHGYRLHRQPMSYSPYFAQAQAIFVDSDGSMSGASDPRADGGVALGLP